VLGVGGTTLASVSELLLLGSLAAKDNLLVLLLHENVVGNLVVGTVVTFACFAKLGCSGRLGRRLGFHKVIKRDGRVFFFRSHFVTLFGRNRLVSTIRRRSGVLAKTSFDVVFVLAPVAAAAATLLAFGVIVALALRSVFFTSDLTSLASTSTVASTATAATSALAVTDTWILLEIVVATLGWTIRSFRATIVASRS
jgi:hypothetical protein